jgi:hypothetical protein
MHAVANIGSQIANTPAIIKSLQPMARRDNRASSQA